MGTEKQIFFNYDDFSRFYEARAKFFLYVKIPLSQILFHKSILHNCIQSGLRSREDEVELCSTISDSIFNTPFYLKGP